MRRLARRKAPRLPLDEAEAIGLEAVWEALRTHRPERAKLITWVWAKIIYRLADAARSPDPESDELPEDLRADGDLDDLIEHQERRAALHRALATLKPGHRTAVEDYLRTGRITGHGRASKPRESRQFLWAFMALKERMT